MIRSFFFFGVFSLIVGCSQNDRPKPADQTPSTPSSGTATASTAFPAKLASEHLPNPVQIHKKVISGGLPEGDAAFQELADLGVKTVISVDGAKPDIEAAQKYRLRYVHLPHGYDGIPEDRVQELAKVVRDLDGLIYIHCHHGEHRSPAAASVACVSAGLVSPSQAVPILELAGTSPNYRGLYESAKNAFALDSALLDELEDDFQAIVEVPPLAEAMVQLGHTHDHLKMVAEAGWETPKRHPDLEPAHAALLVREHFTELLRTEEAQQQPSDFRQLLRDSELAARELEETLQQWQPAAGGSELPKAIPAAASRIAANCKACHLKYRDVPLSER